MEDGFEAEIETTDELKKRTFPAPLLLKGDFKPDFRKPTRPLQYHQDASNASTSTLASTSNSNSGPAITPAELYRIVETEAQRDESSRKRELIVDLSHKKIDTLPPDVIQLILDVDKLALGNNLLRDLPSEFSQFTRLRYLNIRINSLTYFPQPLTEMPSLEILDVSRNKIRKFPAVPGTLINVKVLSVVRNRIRRLPSYFTQMTSLRVLKLEHNPFEYPPREVLTPPASSNPLIADSDSSKKREGNDPEMLNWIYGISDYIKAHPEPDPADPPRSRPSDDYDGSQPRPQNGRLLPLTTSSLLAHSRNASHSLESTEQTRPALKSKKSLPDLRQSHGQILAERRTDEPENPLLSISDTTQGRKTARSVSRTPTKSLLRTNTPPSKPRPLTPTGTGTRQGEFQRLMQKQEISSNPSGGFDRNSGAYFRRLSMLPASSISKTVPITLLNFAEAIRGVLFSLCQIYASFRQFVIFASQDTLPASLARLMGTADNTTSMLINELDRFDSLTRRGTPENRIIRGLFSSCRDNVATFRKLVSELAPEMESLVATADIRYARTLLLMLYGSTGEIAKSWSQVMNQTAQMRELFLDPSAASSPTTSTATHTPSGSVTRITPPAIARARSVTRRHAGSFSADDVEVGASIPPASRSAASLASYVESHSNLLTSHLENKGMGINGGLGLPTMGEEGEEEAATVRARPRGKKPRPAMLNTADYAPAYPSHMGSLSTHMPVMNAFEQPLTPGGNQLVFQDYEQGSIGSLTSYPLHRTSSSRSTASNPNTGKLANSPPLHKKTSSKDVRLGTTTTDESFLDMVESSTSTAFDVYGMILDTFDNMDPSSFTGPSALGPKRTKELIDLCILGNEATTRLTGSLRRVVGNREEGVVVFAVSDAKRLGNDAFAFVNIVIRFAKYIKSISLEYEFPLQVREGVSTLTLTTREFAKALSNNPTFRPLTQTNGGGSSLGQSHAGGSGTSFSLSQSA